MTRCAARGSTLALVLLALLAAAAPAGGQERLSAPARARLDAEIRRAIADARIPSLTVALVDRGGIVWSGAYGESNLWAHTPATEATVYAIGSTFKAQSTVALLQQMERGAFRLDDPVRDLLAPFRIRREEPRRPVTFRQLLTHTSGLPAGFGPHPVWGETVPVSLESYVRDSLALVSPPGATVLYSNVAFALVGWLVERITGEPYQDYVREHVWQPLGMSSTAFAPTPAMEERLAVPYVVDEQGRLAPTERLKANVWPAGVVYGTIEDQARWLAFNLGDGAAPDGTRLLREETLEAMLTLQDREHAGARMAGQWGYEQTGYGLGWWTTRRGAERFFGHSGSLPGYTAFLMGNRDRGVGIALLTNADQAQDALVRLADLALDLMAEPPRMVVQP
jgi:CubicO group peptidase (beta-lactamase class C family)